MKRLLLLFTCAVLIFSAAVCYALPVGNIGSPASFKKGMITKDEKSQFGFVLGAEVDLNADHNMKDQAKDTEYSFYGGRAGIVMADRACVYGLVGAAEAEQKYKISGKEVEWDTDADLSWGIGGTVVVYEKDVEYSTNKGVMRVGFDGKYRVSDLDVDKVKIDNAVYHSSDAAVTEQKFDCDEWQVAAGVSFQFNTVSPYAGVKYSDASGEAKATVSGKSYEYDFDPKSNFGIFAGVDILAFDCFTINAEGRFIDETAFSAGATLKF